MHIQMAILHAQNTYNNGSFMLLINFIWYYVRHTPASARVTFWIELDGTDNHERIMQALPGVLLSDKRVAIRRLPFAITSADHASPLKKAFKLYDKYYRHPRLFRALGIDAVIILGGDDISEYYKKWLIVSDLYRIRRYAGSFRTILAGQTIGPFQGFREKMAAKCLARTIIFSRDELTASYLTERLHLPEERVLRSADLSFPEIPLPEKRTDIMADLGLVPDGYIILVPGGHYTLYTQNKEFYIASWVRLVQDLLRHGGHLSRQIVFLPHVTRPEDDREIIHLILDSLGDAEGIPDRIRVVDEELLPHQLREILGNGYLTVSSRLHAALSALQRNKPAIALGYSVKYDGVIGSSLQCAELLVHCTGDLITAPERFSKAVLRKINHVDQHYRQITAHLAVRIPELQVMAEDQIRNIARMSRDTLNK